MIMRKEAYSIASNLSEQEQLALAEELLTIMKDYHRKLDGSHLGRGVDIGIQMLDYSIKQIRDAIN